jgi:hypothetical protein
MVTKYWALSFKIEAVQTGIVWQRLSLYTILLFLVQELLILATYSTVMVNHALDPSYEDSIGVKFMITLQPLIPCAVIFLAFRRIFKYSADFTITKG